MLYAVIMRFDSLREIMPSIQAEARKPYRQKPANFVISPISSSRVWNVILATGKRRRYIFDGTWDNKIPLDHYIFDG